MAAATSNAERGAPLLPVKAVHDMSDALATSISADNASRIVSETQTSESDLDQRYPASPFNNRVILGTEGHVVATGPTTNGVPSHDEVNNDIATIHLQISSPPSQLFSDVTSAQESGGQDSAQSLTSSLEPSAVSSVPVNGQVAEMATALPSGLPHPAATSGSATAPILQMPTSAIRLTPQPPGTTPPTDLRMKTDDVTEGLTTSGLDLSADNSSQEHLISIREQHPDEGVHMDSSFDAPPVTDINLPPRSAHPSPQPSAVVPTTEQPRHPAPTPTLPPMTTEPEPDHHMPDAPSSPIKVAHEREEDGDTQEPLAKRTKTEGGSAEPDFKVPDLPQPALSPVTQNGGNAHNDAKATDADIVTQPRLAHMKKVISNLKKGNSSSSFRTPVDHVALNIPTYPAIVTRPMDLGTIDRKLKEGSYSSIKHFIDDFHLIINNSVAFNGIEHPVTQAAMKMKNSFDNQMRTIPGASVADPSREEKKAAKAKEQPTRALPARRTSAVAPPSAGPTQSPSIAAPPQTFALGPEGIPLIRRDSTANDGRPKRAIHPPKRRDDFGAGRPRKKKYEWQLRFCEEVVKDLKKPKHYQYAQYFLEPVDAVALNIPNYHQVIKRPMDLRTVEEKLKNNQYERAKDFEEDVRLIFKNCYKFNPKGDFVYQSGEKFEKVFDDKWATKEEWLAQHEPTSEPQSPGEDEDDEGDPESEEDEADDSDAERNEKLHQLQKQIAEMSKQMGELAQPKKKKKLTPPATAPGKKSSKPKGSKKEKQAASFPTLQGPAKEKKKTPKAKLEKERFVTYAEKQYISTGVSQLPDAKMSEALRMIQSNVPSLKGINEAEIELDIDELPNHVLLKLLAFVKRNGAQAPPEPEPQPEPAFTTSTVPAAKPKKNKPMSKHEQEAQIEELKGKLGAYQGGPTSPDPRKSSSIVHIQRC